MTSNGDREDDDGDPSPSVLESVEEFEQVRRDAAVLLVDWYADWCRPCRTMAPVVDQLADDHPATVLKVDVESFPDLAAQYDVGSLPTFDVFVEGQPTERVVGKTDRTELERALE